LITNTTCCHVDGVSGTGAPFPFLFSPIYFSPYLYSIVVFRCVVSFIIVVIFESLLVWHQLLLLIMLIEAHTRLHFLVVPLFFFVRAFT